MALQSKSMGCIEAKRVGLTN